MRIDVAIFLVLLACSLKGQTQEAEVSVNKKAGLAKIAPAVTRAATKASAKAPPSTIHAMVGTKAMTADSRELRVPINDAPAVDKTAVVIGINDYLNVGRLKACGNDARAFARFLHEKLGFPQESIILMTDDSGARRQPNFRNITRTLHNWVNTIDEHTEVVFYFSGHGLRAGNIDYLAPLDAEADAVTETCYSYNKLRDELESKMPRRCLMITDACRNLFDKAAGANSFGAHNYGTEPQFAELRSCGPKQRSREMPDGSLGVFTYFLLKGLEGEAATLTPDSPNITFDGLKRYVTGSTSRFVLQNFDSIQTPDGRASYGDMALLPIHASRAADSYMVPQAEKYVTLPRQEITPPSLALTDFIAPPNRNLNTGDSEATTQITNDSELPSLSISDALSPEDIGGVKKLRFEIKLSKACNYIVTVRATCLDNTAKTRVDYSAQNDLLTFWPGETKKNWKILLLPGTPLESGKMFFATLSEATNAKIVKPQGTGKY